MPEVIVIGTAVTDIMAAGMPPVSAWLEKQRIGKLELMTGGDGANQSLRLSDLGRKTGLVACIGNDTAGRMILGELERRKVDTGRIRLHKSKPTGNSLVLVGTDGERHTFSAAGAHGELTKDDVKGITEGNPKAVSLASLFSMPYLEDDGLEELLKECRAKGILTCADLGSDKRQQGLSGIRRFLPLLDYFLPSEDDALRMTGTSSPEEAAGVFADCGAGCVVIKCGEKGAYWKTGEASGWVPAKKVRPVDTTGAGDCMVAYFIHGILAGKSVEDACRAACAAASLSTLLPGANTFMDYS